MKTSQEINQTVKNHVIFVYHGFNKNISYLVEIKDGRRFFSHDKSLAMLVTFNEGLKIKEGPEEMIFAF